MAEYIKAIPRQIEICIIKANCIKTLPSNEIYEHQLKEECYLRQLKSQLLGHNYR